MTTAIEDIETYYRARKAERGPLLNRWSEVARQYDGDIVVPLPELDRDERSMAVNLMGPFNVTRAFLPALRDGTIDEERVAADPV